MTAKTDFTEADIAVGRHCLQNIARDRRGLDAIDQLISLVENHNQVISERRRRLEAINAEIARREAAVIDSAESEAKRRAAKITAEAREQAKSIVAEAQRQRDAASAAVVAKQSELTALQKRIDEAKSQIQAVLSSV